MENKEKTMNVNIQIKDILDIPSLKKYDELYDITYNFKEFAERDTSFSLDQFICETMEKYLSPMCREGDFGTDCYGYALALLYDCVYRCEWEIKKYDSLSVNVVNVITATLELDIEKYEKQLHDSKIN